MVKLTDKLKTTSDQLARALEHNGGNAHAHAKYFRDTIVSAMAFACSLLNTSAS